MKDAKVATAYEKRKALQDLRMFGFCEHNVELLEEALGSGRCLLCGRLAECCEFLGIDEGAVRREMKEEFGREPRRKEA